MTKTKLDEVQITNIAKLANLNLTDNEKSGYSDQLSKIVNYIDELDTVDTKKIEPTIAPIDIKNVYREDLAQTGLSQKEALLNAKSVKNGMFKNL